jgi:enterochelin esterase-like enzyme
MKPLDPARFRHVSLSSPEHESEGIRHLTVFSNALRRRGDISFASPPARLLHEHLPIILLLHGVYGSHWSWFLQGGAHRVASAMYQAGTSAPFVLACPSDGLFAEGGGYLPQHDGDFEAWILEVPDLIRAAVPSCTEASPVVLCGLSMGGYGALRLGAKYPERFAAISAHSPITRIEEFRNFLAADQAEELFAQQARDWNILECISDNRDRLPPLRFDCGSEDDLRPGNDELHAALTRLGIAHTYEQLPGAHDWSYWHENFPRSLSFFTQVLLKA